jgi:hypothetical protein
MGGGGTQKVCPPQAVPAELKTREVSSGEFQREKENKNFSIIYDSDF